jgi:hypothetical protein
MESSPLHPGLTITPVLHSPAQLKCCRCFRFLFGCVSPLAEPLLCRSGTCPRVILLGGEDIFRDAAARHANCWTGSGMMEVRNTSWDRDRGRTGNHGDAAATEICLR